jgi:hypothetical protein
MSVVKDQGPDDLPHNQWRKALGKLLGRDAEDIVGYVVIAVIKDKQLIVDTNSAGPEGVLSLLDEARRMITEGNPNVAQADI